MAQRGQNKPRPWYVDGAAGLAFATQAIFLGKFMARVLGPMGGLFFFTINAALAYFFLRAAWREILKRRGG